MYKMKDLNVNNNGDNDDFEEDGALDSDIFFIMQKAIQRSDRNQELCGDRAEELPNSPLLCQVLRGLNTRSSTKGVMLQGQQPEQDSGDGLPTCWRTRRKNMIAQSQSGNREDRRLRPGHAIRVNTDQNWPQVLCLCPTFELAIQIGEVADNRPSSARRLRSGMQCGEVLPRGTKLT